jgi:hypothetical protein
VRTEGAIKLRQQAAPANPAAGLVLAYAKADGRMYCRDSAGTEYDLTTSGLAATLANATTVAETVIATYNLPANFLVAGSVLDLRVAGQVSSTGTLIFKIRCGTAGLITDALVATFATSAAGVANAWARMQAEATCLTAGTSGTVQASGLASLANGVVGVATAAFASATVNTTVAQKLTVTVTQSAIQTFTTRLGVLERMI